MSFVHILGGLIILLVWADKVNLLENGLARTPPMGWMSWGYYMCGVKCKEKPDKCLNEKLILSVADSFFTEGYQEAGFEYIIIDDCWSLRHRDPDGRLVPDPERFPNGMKYISDYIHTRGLKFGMYTNIADVTCMHYPGSRGHFKEDMKQFAEWQVDYIKVDGCFVEENYLDTAYIKLGHYINKTGRPMVYSCSWPYYKEYIHKKTPKYSEIVPHCNLWRNYHDVQLSWGAIMNIILHYETIFPEIWPYHGPGHWNDPDMLVFGTGTLTPGQSRVQLAVYALMSAPLLLSCDMNKITKYEKSLLQNLDLIAIAQDTLGIMAEPFKIRYLVTLWVKRHLPMKGDQFPSYSFALVNLSHENQYVTFTPGDYGLNSEDPYIVLNIFTGKFMRNITLNDKVEVMVPPEDVTLYTLYPI